MDKALRPDRLDKDPNEPDAAREWLHWRRTFENYIHSFSADNIDTLKILTNFVSPKVFQYIEECVDLTSAFSTLESLFIKPTNEIYARHLLATRRQQQTETLTEYLQSLRQLSKDCKFKAVSATRYRDECIRDAFISGIASSSIRQRLLEYKSLDLETMFEHARSLESAAQSSETYAPATPAFNAALPNTPPKNEIPSSNPPSESKTVSAAVSSRNPKCFFCGYNKHPRYKCPAREVTCSKCHKEGHYARVCRGTPVSNPKPPSASSNATLATTQATSGPLSKSSACVTINGQSVEALFNSGSSESFIHPDIVKKANLRRFPIERTVAMAKSSFSTTITSYCVIDLEYRGRKYEQLKVSVLPNLCTNLILGLDFQAKHESVTFEYGGSETPLTVCNLGTLNLLTPFRE